MSTPRLIDPQNARIGSLESPNLKVLQSFLPIKRQPNKQHAMISRYTDQEEIHTLPPCEAGMETSPEPLAQCSIEGTLSILVSGGNIQAELFKLTAVLSQYNENGEKVTLEEIRTVRKSYAGIIIENGRQKFYHSRPSSIIIDFSVLKLLPYGAYYNLVQHPMLFVTLRNWFAE
ncbi:uncharacterized protein N7498_007953 [Penicillium cinerascens]|uniref:Uncharacterized protein n=1 Tax=Penicillium cinerascens TaxID=70096 RepID=A0A9W9M9R3_9EURO|nr:uncharacterized protein N7498_007953 [Penicillium cinerascens]KAJ5194515.1 hypothetical protein N7498_007953 [Penicillium cinerascens]